MGPTLKISPEPTSSHHLYCHQPYLSHPGPSPDCSPSITGLPVPTLAPTLCSQRSSQGKLPKMSLMCSESHFFPSEKVVLTMAHTVLRDQACYFSDLFFLPWLKVPRSAGLRYAPHASSLGWWYWLFSPPGMCFFQIQAMPTS